MEHKETYLRFDIARRIEHLLLIISFGTLAVTGLVQKYIDFGVSQWLITALGGIEVVRIIHRVAATLFMLETIYHFILLAYKVYVQRVRASMMLGKQDIVDVIQFVLYNLGFRKEHPRMGRYNFVEKAEYWAVLWGVFMMGLTGFMLWNPIITARILPGEFIPAAKVAHGLEAVLAVLAILLWHFYGVHLKTWNWSMIKGTLTKHQMLEEHAKEVEEIANGEVGPRNSPEEQKKRMRIFAPFAAVSTVIFLFLAYQFVSAETSSVTTVPPMLTDVPAFVRQTPTPMPTKAPTPTPLPGAAENWDQGIGALFAANCGACHGTQGELSLATYADAMKGGKNGPAIVKGDPDGSLLIKTMGTAHPKVFEAADLAKIVAWIKKGAPEK